MIYVREHALGHMIFSNKNSQPIVLGQLKCIESLYFFKNLNYYRNPSAKKAVNIRAKFIFILWLISNILY